VVSLNLAWLIIQDDDKKAKVAMGQLGRLTTVKDLPSSKLLASYIKQAMKLNAVQCGSFKASGETQETASKTTADFLRTLRVNKKALATFEGFSPSHQREYIEWITGAKTEETRERRLETAIDWMSEGKSRNWKYQRR